MPCHVSISPPLLASETVSSYFFYNIASVYVFTSKNNTGSKWRNINIHSGFFNADNFSFNNVVYRWGIGTGGQNTFHETFFFGFNLLILTCFLQNRLFYFLFFF